jgi:hypothetical protein
VLVDPFLGFEIFERFVTHLQPFQMDHSHILGGTFPNLALLQFHERKINLNDGRGERQCASRGVGMIRRGGGNEQECPGAPVF